MEYDHHNVSNIVNISKQTMYMPGGSPLSPLKAVG